MTDGVAFESTHFGSGQTMDYTTLMVSYLNIDVSVDMTVCIDQQVSAFGYH